MLRLCFHRVGCQGADNNQGVSLAMVLRRICSTEVPRSAAIGLISGLIGSLVGVGGAVISIPLLHHIGFPLRMAQGCSTAVVLGAGLAGAVGYHKNGYVRWKDSACMSITGVIFAAAGTKLAQRVHSISLKRAFGVFLICVGPAIMLRPPVVAQDRHLTSQCAKTLEDAKKEQNTSDGKTVFPREVKLACLGSVAGLLNGFFGIGGGLLTVPSLASFPDMTHREILGTSLSATVLPAMTSAALHIHHGTFMARAAVPLATGALMGSSFGSIILSPVLSTSILKGLFACLTVGLGGKTLKETAAAFRRPKVP